MDDVTLKKKLSSYVSDGGYLRNVSDEVLWEVLIAWENWTGTAKEFYRMLGYSSKQMAGLIGKAKKLRREGFFGQGEFKAVAVEGVVTGSGGGGGDSHPCSAAEVVWGDGRVIRFHDVAVLVEFLKKSA